MRFTVRVRETVIVVYRVSAKSAAEARAAFGRGSTTVLLDRQALSTESWQVQSVTEDDGRGDVLSPRLPR